MKRVFIIALAVLALPLLGGPVIRNSPDHFYQPINWSVIFNGIIGFLGSSLYLK